MIKGEHFVAYTSGWAATEKMAFLPNPSVLVVFATRSQATRLPSSLLERTREGSTGLQDKEVTRALVEEATEC